MTDLATVLNEIKKNGPLIHCITNPISINDCANAVLSLGAHPIMSEHPDEVEQITSCAAALDLNIGNITDARLKSIKLSGLTACEKKIPSLLDMVGIACSDLRFEFVNNLLSVFTPTVIKGNISEIKKLSRENTAFVGLDSAENTKDETALYAYVQTAARLAQKYGTIVFATGETDIITDGKKTFICNNGSAYMPKLTGTGCMLSAVTAVFLSAAAVPAIESTALAAAVFGICGETAEQLCLEGGRFAGLGTYHVKLMDALSTIEPKEFQSKLKLYQIFQ